MWFWAVLRRQVAQDESKQYISQNPCSDYLKQAFSQLLEALWRARMGGREANTGRESTGWVPRSFRKDDFGWNSTSDRPFGSSKCSPKLLLKHLLALLSSFKGRLRCRATCMSRPWKRSRSCATGNGSRRTTRPWSTWRIPGDLDFLHCSNPCFIYFCTT